MYFADPTDGATVPPTFTVGMAAEGLTVEPAGEVRAGAGHFHILIDTDFIPAGQVIPKDDQHRHFGDGATEAELTLDPGPHTLRLQFANGGHEALDGDQFRDTITITVAEAVPALIAETPAVLPSTGSGGLADVGGGGLSPLHIAGTAAAALALSSLVGWRLLRRDR